MPPAYSSVAESLLWQESGPAEVRNRATFVYSFILFVYVYVGLCILNSKTSLRSRFLRSKGNVCLFVLLEAILTCTSVFNFY